MQGAMREKRQSEHKVEAIVLLVEYLFHHEKLLVNENDRLMGVV